MAEKLAIELPGWQSVIDSFRERHRTDDIIVLVSPAWGLEFNGTARMSLVIAPGDAQQRERFPVDFLEILVTGVAKCVTSGELRLGFASGAITAQSATFRATLKQETGALNLQGDECSLTRVNSGWLSAREVEEWNHERA